MKTTIFRLALGLASAITITQSHAGFVIKAERPIELYAKAQRSSTFDGCKELFPGGQPIPLTVVSADWKPRGLCSDSFAVLHSGRSKTPLVVIERLNRQHVDNADEERTNKFFPDPRLPDGERAHLDDYKGSGFDRGHMAAAGNAPTPNSMAQSFSLANIVPQDPTNNQKIWKKLETDTRKYYKGFPTSQAAPDRGGVRSTSPRNGIGSCTRARRLWRRDSEHKVRTGCTTNGH